MNITRQGVGIAISMVMVSTACTLMAKSFGSLGLALVGSSFVGACLAVVALRNHAMRPLAAVATVFGAVCGAIIVSLLGGIHVTIWPAIVLASSIVGGCVWAASAAIVLQVSHTSSDLRPEFSQLDDIPPARRPAYLYIALFSIVIGPVVGFAFFVMHSLCCDVHPLDWQYYLYGYVVVGLAAGVLVGLPYGIIWLMGK